MSNRDLVSALQETSSLLRGVAAPFWANRIDELLDECHDELVAWHAQKVLSWYGGMGSFSDLLISAVNGHDVQNQDEDKLNGRLDELREVILEGATRLAREQ